MPEPNHKALAHLMAGVTRSVLWEAWSESTHQGPPARLHCRAGRGRATYHRFHPHSNRHEIVFGALMVADKQMPDRGENWLSTREVRRRAYWNGEVSTLNLLAHTCCHEFAHLQQHCIGQRHYGQVHNPAFYQLLDGLHASGAADEVRRQLERQARAQQLQIDAQPWPAPAAGTLQSLFQPGDHVRFGQGKHLKTGRIVKINRRTCTVEGMGRIAGRRYRVPGPLLEKISRQ